MAESLSVALVHARWRHLTWVAIGIVGGALLIWRFGTLAKGFGAILVLVGANNLVQFARTFMHPPGAFEFSGGDLSLPRGMCRGAPLVVRANDVRHAYFLRRAVPWTRTGPILVIELAGQALSYPRDWFATDGDQKRVAGTINKHLGIQ